ncbi:MAG: hypothetical protein JW702_09380 [Clostridiales bacterium]|nr:hypothetical protein [Clostridiales bacterium]
MNMNFYIQHLRELENGTNCSINAESKVLFINKGLTLGSRAKNKLYSIEELNNVDNLPIQGIINSTTFDKTGRIFAAALDSPIDYWNLKINLFIYNLETKTHYIIQGEKNVATGVHGSLSIEFNPQGNLIAVSDKQASLFIIDISTLFEDGSYKIPFRFDFTYSNSLAIAWSSDGKTIAYLNSHTNNCRNVDILKVISDDEKKLELKQLISFRHKAYGSSGIFPSIKYDIGISYSSNSNLICVGGDKKDDTIKLYSIVDEKILYQSPRLNSPINTVRFDKSDQFIFSGSVDGNFRIWQIINSKGKYSLEQIYINKFSDSILKFSISNDENKIYIVSKNNKKIILSSLDISELCKIEIENPDINENFTGDQEIKFYKPTKYITGDGLAAPISKKYYFRAIFGWILSILGLLGFLSLGEQDDPFFSGILFSILLLGGVMLIIFRYRKIKKNKNTG